MTRDPRFDELSGTFNQEKFDKAYSFLGEIKANEKKVRIAIKVFFDIYPFYGGLYMYSQSWIAPLSAASNMFHAMMFF